MRSNNQIDSTLFRLIIFNTNAPRHEEIRGKVLCIENRSDGTQHSALGTQLSALLYCAIFAMLTSRKCFTQ